MLLASIPPIGWFFLFLSACIVGIVAWSCFFAWLRHREDVERIKAQAAATEGRRDTHVVTR